MSLAHHIISIFLFFVHFQNVLRVCSYIIYRMYNVKRTNSADQKTVTALDIYNIISSHYNWHMLCEINEKVS